MANTNKEYSFYINEILDQIPLHFHERVYQDVKEDILSRDGMSLFASQLETYFVEGDKTIGDSTESLTNLFIENSQHYMEIEADKEMCTIIQDTISYIFKSINDLIEEFFGHAFQMDEYDIQIKAISKNLFIVQVHQSF